MQAVQSSSFSLASLPTEHSDHLKRSLGRWLVFVVLIANLLLIGVCWVSLMQSRTYKLEEVQSSTAHQALMVENFLSDSIKQIDLALTGVTDVLEHGGHLTSATRQKLLSTYQQRLPGVGAFRVSDATGRVLWGEGVTQDSPVTFSDRPFFDEHRAAPGQKLIVFGPIWGRISDRWVYAFTRSYRHANGSFAGIVTAAVPVSYFSAQLTKTELGPHGSAILRGTDLGLVGRYPIVEGEIGEIGNRKVSPEFLEVFESGAETAMFHTANTPDGVERTYSLRRVRGMPAVVVVGMAPEDYLQAWYGQTVVVIFGLLATLALSGLGIWFVYRAWDQQVKLSIQSAEQQRFLHTLLESVPLPIFYKDRAGYYQGCNEAFCQLIKRPRQEILGKTVFDLASSDIARYCHEMDQALFSHSGVQAYEWFVPDGEFGRREAAFNCATYTHLDGGIGGLVGAISDLSTQKQTQRELMESRARYRRLASQLEVMVQEKAAALTKSNEKVATSHLSFSAHGGFQPESQNAGLQSEQKNVWQVFLASVPGLSVDLGLVRLRGNHQKYCQLLQQFYEMHLADVELIREQISVGQSETDWPVVKQLAHTLKGSSGTLGLTKLQHLAAELEKWATGDQEITKIVSLLVDIDTEFDALKQVMQSFPRSPETENRVDRSLLKTHLQMLKQLLATGDFQSGTCFQEISATLRDWAGPKIVDEVERKISQCDFEEALPIVEVLLSQLSVSDQTQIEVNQES